MRRAMENHTSSFPAKHYKPKHSRSSGKRSHGACLTCKQRHLKCDETRPTCLACTKKGVACAGYPQPLKWSYKHQRGVTSTTRDRQAHESESSSGARKAVPCPAAQKADDGHPTRPSPSLHNDRFSPSYLLSLDGLDSVDQAFGGMGELDCANLFDFGEWPMDLSLGTSGHSLDVRHSLHHPPEGASLDQSSLSGPEHMNLVLGDLAGGGVDSAMRLIDNWFNEVCPAWSGFDSTMNMNRKLAEDLWHSSPAVFKSLQSMSASFLAARLPQMRRPALAQLKTATLAIQSELEELNNRAHLDAVPTGVIFALICVGTTVCWLDARRVGWPFLQDAKSLLARTLQQDLLISEEDAAVLDFFHKSLAYWGMLIDVLYDPSPEKDHESAMSLGIAQHPSIDSGRSPLDSRPHPWTGISLLTCRLLAQTMRVCRTYRRRQAELSGARLGLWPAIREVDEAKKLEERLLQLEFSDSPPTSDTGDRRTPYLHLIYVAEAYQLTALLLLYITFPDLVSLRLPHESHRLFERSVPWYKWIVPLALRITQVLERIPPDSGSHALQPLLYICAATGLRYGSASDLDDHQASSKEPLRPVRPMESILDYLTLLEDPEEGHGRDNFSVPQLALDVSKARSFILRRLGVLKDSLHPVPVSVAESLVKAIWSAYDEEPQGCTDVYWIEILEQKDLRTLFG